MPSPNPNRSLTRSTLAEAAAKLAARDSHLAIIFHQHGPPPMWGRSPTFDTLVKIILEQQVSLVSAKAVYERLIAAISPFDPLRFIEVGEKYLRERGVTRQKASYCIHLAEAAAAGKLDRLRRLSDEDARATLLNIKGIGPWSADVYLLMALKRPDIWPNGDVALATAVKELRSLPTRPTYVELEQISQTWCPYRSVAARMLWQYYLARRNRL